MSTDKPPGEAKAAFAAWLADRESRIGALRAAATGKAPELSHRQLHDLVHDLAGRWYDWFVRHHLAVEQARAPDAVGAFMVGLEPVVAVKEAARPDVRGCMAALNLRRFCPAVSGTRRLRHESFPPYLPGLVSTVCPAGRPERNRRKAGFGGPADAGSAARPSAAPTTPHWPPQAPPM